MASHGTARTGPRRVALWPCTCSPSRATTTSFSSPTPTGRPTSSSCPFSDRASPGASPWTPPGSRRRTSRSRAGKLRCPGRKPTGSARARWWCWWAAEGSAAQDHRGPGQGPPQPVVGLERLHLLPARPAELVGLRLRGDEGGLAGGDHEVAQVQVLVGRLRTPGGYVVHVHVQGAGRGGLEEEPFDPRLLPRLPQGHVLAAGLAGVGVPSRLQPAVQLAVMEEQHAVRARGDHDRAAREVPLPDAALEGTGVA